MGIDYIFVIRTDMEKKFGIDRRDRQRKRVHTCSYLGVLEFIRKRQIFWQFPQIFGQNCQKIKNCQKMEKFHTFFKYSQFFPFSDNFVQKLLNLVQ